MIIRLSTLDGTEVRAFLEQSADTFETLMRDFATAVGSPDDIVVSLHEIAPLPAVQQFRTRQRWHDDLLAEIEGE